MLRLFLSSLFFLWLSTSAFCQYFEQKDLVLLQQAHVAPVSSHLPTRPFLVSGKTWLAKYNPIKLFFASSMYFYQNVVSAQLNSNCPYQHSCSAFSKLCIGQHGLVKGFFLTGDRLTRCSTFGLRDVRLLSDFHDNKIIDEPASYHY